jgi:hypothetical protein
MALEFAKEVQKLQAGSHYMFGADKKRIKPLNVLNLMHQTVPLPSSRFPSSAPQTHP